jgi:hypothetical protein
MDAVKVTFGATTTGAFTTGDGVPKSAACAMPAEVENAKNNGKNARENRRNRHDMVSLPNGSVGLVD